MTHSVFLSYARSDGLPAATQLQQLLTEEDIAAWQDLRELDPDGTVWTQIETALKTAEYLIVLITPKALDSDYIRREWREARRNGASVLPVMAVEMPRGDLPRWLRRGEVFRLDDPPQLQKFLTKLRGNGKIFRADWHRGLEIEAFINRPALMADIKRQLLSDDGTPVGLSSALHGQGGFGKSVLAGNVARDPDIRDAFLDGIYWIELGQDNPDVLTKLNNLIARIGGRGDAVDVNTASEDLSVLLEKRDVLLIVDDVWRSQDLSPFAKAVGEGQAALLATTRIAASLPRRFTPVEVSEMEEDEALAVLSRDLDPDATETGYLKSFAARFWHWPQLLAISNGILLGRVQDGQPLCNAVDTLTQAITAGSLPGEDERNRTIQSVMDMGVHALSGTDQARFRQLAIVPEDTSVPIALFAALWEMDQITAEEFAGKLLRLGLLQSRVLSRAVEARSIRLHDNMLWYLSTHTSESERTEIQSRFLHTHCPTTGRWADLPDTKQYLWQNLLFHLRGAGNAEEITRLQIDYDWISGKLAVLGANAVSSDYLPTPQNPTAALIGRAITLSLPALRGDPTQLGWQLWGRSWQQPELSNLPLLSRARTDCNLLEPVSAYLTSPGHQLLRIPAGGSVRCTAFSPDGQRIVSGGADRTLRLWDAQTGAQIGAPLRGHEDVVNSVAFSPDGKRIVSGGDDKTPRLWDAETGAQIGAPLRGHKDWVRSVAFSPDGQRIVSGGDDKTLRLWDAQTGVQIDAPLRGHEGRVWSVAFSPDGQRIVSGGRDATLRLWDAQTGAQIDAPLRGNEDWVTNVAFSPDGQRIVSGSYDRTLRLWDAQTGAQIGEPLRGHKDWVTSVAFSLDGQRIVSGSYDRTLRLWDAQTGAQIGAPLRGHEGGVYSVAFSPDGQRIVSGSTDARLRLWDAQTGAQIGAPLRGHEGWVRSVDMSPDGQRIVSGGHDRTLRLWDAQTGAQIGRSLCAHEGAVFTVAFSPDGQRIVSGSTDATLRLWDAQTGVQIDAPLRGHEGGVYSVAFSPDGQRIVSGSTDATLRLWDAQTGAQIGAPLRGHEGGVWSVAFSSDGQRIVSGGIDATLRLWDAHTGAQIGAPLRGHEDVVFSVAYSPDGLRFVSGGDDKTLRLWDAQTGAQIGAPLRGHEGEVWSVAFSHDGQSIVSGGTDETLRLWDAQTRDCLAMLHFDSAIQSVSASQEYVAAGGRQGKVHTFRWSKSDD